MFMVGWPNGYCFILNESVERGTYRCERANTSVWRSIDLFRLKQVISEDWLIDSEA